MTREEQIARIVRQDLNIGRDDEDHLIVILEQFYARFNDDEITAIEQTYNDLDANEWEAEFPGCTVVNEDTHRVIEFDKADDVQRFLDSVGGAPHPFGGNRVVLSY